METAQKIQRVTSKGQITLPISWRRRMGTHSIVVRPRGDILEISSLRTPDEEDEAWVTIFDAIRDNNGKGIPVDKMIAALKKSIPAKK
ncbi:MAG: AbrB/MazE/SpoVT family DNA-binding domain-containing protein [Candidatus Paceibacterota bacterium]|jgi:bifunctional DNA-binding transcriptional regulator/antitoxin component of YhaV-PrlF toxin-antitoxin module